MADAGPPPGRVHGKARPGWETGILKSATLPREDSPRHWTLDAALGATAAISAIAIAQAALPDRAPALTMTATPPPAAARVPVPEAPSHLIAFTDPVAGREVISPFGLRQLPWEENGRLHEGVDIAAPLGSTVQAAADGVVADAGKSPTYGRFVRVRHAVGLTTLYAHMGAVAPGMLAGRVVKAGAALGQIGSSGTSTGPHLHFELRDARDRPLNPGLFLGQQFFTAAELPLKAARRVPRGVRIAWVSRIPESKREKMEAKLLRISQARNVSSAAQDASSVTVIYGDGRPRARFRVAAPTPPATTPTFVPIGAASAKAPATAASASAPPASDAPIATAEAPAAE